MAQVSVQIAQDHIATAFHFFISKRLPLRVREPPARLELGPSTSIIFVEAMHAQTNEREKTRAFTNLTDGYY